MITDADGQRDTDRTRGTEGDGGPAEADAADPAMLREVRAGLARPQKELSPKYFYDLRGSELFEEITELPEYYLTRTERSLLERWAPRWMDELVPAALVELGAGSARKTRILLDAMEGRRPGGLFVPLDVSAEFLEAVAEQLRDEYPELTVAPEVTDLTTPLDLSVDLPSPALFALLGSTIGNFAPAAAIRLLRHVRATMGPGDRFLLGADLRPAHGKTVERLEAAYDDARGVTAAFNLNVLTVLNRELGADFDPAAFRHRAFYAEGEGRVEMHLVAREAQTVRIPGGPPVEIAGGESIRTEISCKYDRPTIDGYFAAAGLEVQEWREDDDGLYALVLGGLA